MLNIDEFTGLIKNMQYLNTQIAETKQQLLNFNSQNTDVLKTEFCGVIRKFNNAEDQYNDCKRFIRIYDEYMLCQKTVNTLNIKIETFEKSLQEIIEKAYDFVSYDISNTILKNIVAKAEFTVKGTNYKTFNIDVALEVRDILTNC
jgi:hypothetical protein